MSVSCTSHYQTLWQLDDQVHYPRRLSSPVMSDRLLAERRPELQQASVRVNWPLPPGVSGPGQTLKPDIWLQDMLSYCTYYRKLLSLTYDGLIFETYLLINFLICNNCLHKNDQGLQQYTILVRTMLRWDKNSRAVIVNLHDIPSCYIFLLFCFIGSLV